MSVKPIYQVLPPSIRELIQSLPRTILGCLEEIRVRQDRPLEVITSEQSWFVSQNCQLTLQPKESVLPSREDCRKMLNLISNHSLYTMEEELRRGYVTVEGGHRIGLVGKVVMDQGKVKHLRDVTGFNVRMARQVIGVGEPIIPYLFHDNQVENVLIISPPQCGKTTLIRDLARIASTGHEQFASRKVGIVDERSEIAGCVHGVPQHDIGPRTDVLDACPKAEGMMMMIRSMSPEVLVVDEIGRKEDSDAVHEAIYAGVHLFTTVHGKSIEEICHRPILSGLIREGVFRRMIVLSRRQGPGTVELIADQNLRPLKRTLEIPS
ncbi:stage III sporulation protein AA [Hazenella coriacea]|uniref:Stage III sporulation protein AA n=1 Tax=Hazenella coriacea TaxID=1179467 RepID=A0A4R3LFY0_9BACL|nr:stage III sporulation protein AA [Hazenella coriacea]TCS96396.1 stage III sporulation protein AA [Hazenella coriacea]